MTVLLAAAVAGAQFSGHGCNADAVRRDLQQTLAGGVEVTALRISWSTTSEGPDLDHYEVWRRDGNGTGQLLLTLEPAGHCPQRQDHEVVVDYVPGGTYYVEVHVVDRTFLGVVVPIR